MDGWTRVLILENRYSIEHNTCSNYLVWCDTSPVLFNWWVGDAVRMMSMRHVLELVSPSSGQLRRLLTTTDSPSSRTSGRLEFSWQKLWRSAVFRTQVTDSYCCSIETFCEHVSLVACDNKSWVRKWVSKPGRLYLVSESLYCQKDDDWGDH